MTYQQFPYMQAHPPPGYGAPGSTAYYTTQHLGGFYAPISNNQPFPQVHGSAPMLGSGGPPTAGPIGSIGSGGQMFNSWPGHPDEQDKKKQEAEREAERAKQESRSRRREGGDSGKSGGSRNKGHRSMPSWNKVVADIEAGSDGGDDTGSYDDCECSTDSCTVSHCSSIRSDDGSGSDKSSDTEVVIQPGGSAYVVLFLNRKKQDCPPKRTRFVVSARRMRVVARGWPQLCLRGTDTYETTVDDEAAVAGMYWFLQALHTPVAEEASAHGSDYSDYSDYDSAGQGHGQGHRFQPSMTPATTPRASRTSIPTELPARELAYATLFAHQFGVVHNGEPQAIDVSAAATAAAFSPLLGGGDRFRARADVWLRNLASHPRHRRALDGTLIKPADWPFVLYTARVLKDKQLFATCLRTLLDRWYVNERGVFCDASGPARLDLLPERMRETVLRDLASFKAARERSVEAIVGGAMNSFDYESAMRN